MERQSVKHGVAQDDYLKHETEGLVRAGRSTHGEEWVDPEPPGDDQPAVSASPEEPLVGGVPPGMTPRDVAMRSMIAAHLGQAIYPADREKILARLAERPAPDQLVELVKQLPDGQEYHNVREIAVALGFHIEQKRF